MEPPCFAVPVNRSSTEAGPEEDSRKMGGTKVGSDRLLPSQVAFGESPRKKDLDPFFLSDYCPGHLIYK
jgi:hypothetical protein